MLRLVKQNTSKLKYPLYAASVLAFASFGDAFLYPFLPAYATTMKIPVVWIGLLLSINRFVRIAFNPFVTTLFVKFGVRQTTMAAAVAAVVSTFGYSLGLGLISLLLFRILWGMAFAVLRISTLAYAFEHNEVGFSLGVSRAIQESGPVFSLWIGPILLNYFSGENIFFWLAIFSFPALYGAYMLPELEHKVTLQQTRFLGIISFFNSLTFLLSFAVEGLIIVGLGILLAKNHIELTTWMVTSLAAGYLAYRRICLIIFSPISGSLADRVGFMSVFNCSALFIIAGLIFLILGYDMTGLIIIFTFNSVNSSMAPGGAFNNESDKLRAVATNATWRDIGAATGTFTGGAVLSGGFLLPILTVCTFVLIALLWLHYRKVKIK